MDLDLKKIDSLTNLFFVAMWQFKSQYLKISSNRAATYQIMPLQKSLYQLFYNLINNAKLFRDDQALDDEFSSSTWPSWGEEKFFSPFYVLKVSKRRLSGSDGLFLANKVYWSNNTTHIRFCLVNLVPRQASRRALKLFDDDGKLTVLPTLSIWKSGIQCVKEVYITLL